MIRIRGVPISDDEARELARLLDRSDEAAGLVARLDRALADEVGGLVATDRDEARCILVAVRSMLEEERSERLLELRASLVAMLGVDPAGRAFHAERPPGQRRMTPGATRSRA